LGIVILAFRGRLANRKSFDRVIGKNAPETSFSSFFNKFTIKKVPETSFSSGKNIILKIALLYPIVIFFVCGFFSSSIFFMSTDKQALNLIGQNTVPAENLEINALGRVSSHVNNKNGTSYFSLVTDKLLLKDLSSGIEQTINVKDEVFVRIRTNDRYFLKRDDLISFNCRVLSNEGFNSLMAYQDNVVKIDSNNTCQKIYNIRSRFYECIRNTFYNNLDYNAAALSEAIILGNTNNISEKTITDFRKSGIYHLIAISGLHITFFIYLTTVFLNFILRPINAAGKDLRILRLASFIFIIMVLFLYNFIAGEKASALRATVMSVLVLTANLMERQYNKKIILSLSFILLLTLSPEFFYNWGFWLSFTSMAGILYLNPVITDLLKFIRKSVQKSGSYFFGSFPDADDPDNAYKRSKRRLRGENYFVSSIITTVSVNIFLFPVLIFLFRELPVFSIPANLMASPVFYMLLAILLTASFLALLWPPLGGFILKLVGLIVEVLLKIARIYKISDFNVISLSNLKVYHMVIYYFALAAVFIALSLWLDRKKARVRETSLPC
jgi:ComEC/Rec2-related protein